MPIMSYDNPTSIRGNVGYTPNGLLGGVLYNQNQQDYQDNMRMSEQAKQMGLQEQMNQLQDYRDNAPLRDAQRSSGIATANANASTIGDVKAGQAAEGRVNAATVNDQIGMSAIKYRESLQAEQQKKFDSDMSKWDGLAPLISDPTKYQAVRQANPDLNLPEQMNPTDIQQRTLIAKSYLDAKEKRANAKQALANEGNLAVENKRVGAQIKVANIHEAGANSRTQATIGKDMKMSPAQRSTYINHALNNPTLLKKEADSMGVDPDTAKGMLQDEYKNLRVDQAEAATQKEIASRQYEIGMSKTVTPDQIRSATYQRFGLTPPGAGGLDPMASTQQSALPPQAASQLKEGMQTTFANGQVWTKINGQPKRIK